MKKKMSTEDAKDCLRKQGLKLTPIRVETLKALSVADRPYSIEELHSKIHMGDLVSLYRTLSRFTRVGLTVEVDLGLGKVHYEKAPQNQTHQHHVVCRVCEKIEPLDLCGLGPHKKRLEALGYQEIEHSLRFSAICRKCA
ncbi:MAG: Fur family transcriptional regulator [Bdellovibrionales bacterium]